jgi:hypothetical protein
MSLSLPLIVADSYLAMILPDDIAKRISDFISGRLNFPFVGRDELVCLMYLYGKNGGIRNESEVKEVGALAQQTAVQLGHEIDIYANSSSGKLDSEYIRSKYVNRQLQLAVEKKNTAGRISGDPAVIADCFAQHAAHYRHGYSFELYGPLKDSELTSDLRPVLAGRMVMVCYNRKSTQDTGLAHPLIPVYVFFRDQAGAKP